MRIGLNRDEMEKLVEGLKAGVSWEGLKAGPFRDVDPKVLDSGFKEWAHKQAGLSLDVVPAEDALDHALSLPEHQPESVARLKGKRR